MASNTKQQRTNESSRGGRSESQTRQAEGVTGVASRVVERAKDAIKDQIEERVDRSANDLDVLAKTLRLASQQLERNIAAPYLEKLADRVDGLSRFIEEADGQRLLENARKLGRERPLTFVGAAIAFGFIGGRFLRSSGRSAGSEQARESGAATSGNAAPKKSATKPGQPKRNAEQRA